MWDNLLLISYMYNELFLLFSSLQKFSIYWDDTIAWSEEEIKYLSECDITNFKSKICKVLEGI